MTIMVDGVKLSEKRIEKVGEKVREKMKESLTYLTKMMKGLYSGDMNNDEDFRVLQNKIVSELIETNSKAICVDVKGIVKNEMVSVAHQVGSQGRIEQGHLFRRIKGIVTEMDTFDSSEEAMHIDLSDIERGSVKVGEDTVINIDPKALKKAIGDRLVKAGKNKNKKKGTRIKFKNSIIGVDKNTAKKKKKKAKKKSDR